MTRVLILAASALARSGLENLLPRGRYDIVGKVATVEELEEVFADSEPDVILVDAGPDLDSGSRSGLLRALAASDISHESMLIIFADHPAPTWSAEAIRAGARAILPADVSAAQLGAAIEAALQGLVVLHPEETNAVLPQPVGRAPLTRAASVSNAPVEVDDLAEPLTRREREVLQMLASGLANKEIAAKVNLSDHTVKFHVAAILSKLGASSRTEAVTIALRRGLILL